MILPWRLSLGSDWQVHRTKCPSFLNLSPDFRKTRNLPTNEPSEVFPEISLIVNKTWTKESGFAACDQLLREQSNTISRVLMKEPKTVPTLKHKTVGPPTLKHFSPCFQFYHYRRHQSFAEQCHLTWKRRVWWSVWVDLILLRFLITCSLLPCKPGFIWPEEYSGCSAAAAGQQNSLDISGRGPEPMPQHSARRHPVQCVGSLFGGMVIYF